MEQHQRQHEHQNPESSILEPDMDPPSTCPESTTDSHGVDGSVSKPSSNQNDIVRALEVVERDSVAIAESFSSLFASLRLALSEVTSTSIDHMQCFSDAAGRLQESVLDAATKGNRYINSCLRLNEEMKGIDSLATKLYPLPLVFVFVFYIDWLYLYSLELPLKNPWTHPTMPSWWRQLDAKVVGGSWVPNLKILRRNVDTLDTAVNKLIRHP